MVQKYYKLPFMLAGYGGGVVNGTQDNAKQNVNGYLNNGIEFWTMTPAAFYVPYFNGYLLKFFLG